MKIKYFYRIKKMEDYNDIKLLIDRFFEGESSLEEEKRLYAFYSSHSGLPEELESYRNMFAGFGAISFDADSFDAKTSNANSLKERSDNQFWNAVAPVKSIRHRFLYVLSGIAAAISLCVGIFVAIDNRQDHVLAKNYEGSYMIVNGNRIDDLSLIKPEIEKALSLAEHIERHVDEHSVIKSAEKNVLDNVDDPKEKVRIQQLLNE